MPVCLGLDTFHLLIVLPNFIKHELSLQDITSA